MMGGTYSKMEDTTLGEQMSPQQKQELNTLSRNLPTFEAVLEELNAGPGDLFWKYYYPLCFRYTAEFFKDEEEAREAVLPLMEHWVSAAPRHNNKAKLASFFLTVAKNFCLNYQRDNSYGPEIVYNSEENEVLDDDEDVQREVDVVAFVDDYPTNGIDYDDPESIALAEEEAELQSERVAAIRAQLFPGDAQVFDLLLEEYNSEEIASILERTPLSVENALRRIHSVAQ